MRAAESAHFTTVEIAARSRHVSDSAEEWHARARARALERRQCFGCPHRSA